MNQLPDFTPLPDTIFEKDLTQENVIYRIAVRDIQEPQQVTQSQTNPILIIGLVVVAALIFKGRG